MSVVRTRYASLALAAAVAAVAACTQKQADVVPPPDAGATAAPAQAPMAAAAAAPAATRDADAIAALEKMGQALHDLQQFGLTADTSTDYVTDSGQKVTVDGEASYRVRMPDHFVSTVANDRQQREFYYDGKSLTLWSPKLKYYTVIEPVPDTIGGLVTAAAAKGIEFPLPDLFLWGTPQAPLESVTSAVLVGPALVDGEQTDHYAYRQPGVDWQVWVSRETSLPAKVAITSLADPAMPSYSARLHWSPGQGGAEGVFAFKPPADARRIEFVSVDAGAAVEEP